MKKIALLLALLLAFSCALVSCQDDKAVDKNSPDAKITDLWDVPYQYNLDSYIKIEDSDYIGVSYTKSDATVSEAEIYAEIQKLLDEHAIYTDITDRPAQNGDLINIDYKGFIDGEELENGAEEGAEFELGYASFIPGFQEGIVGHSVGETFTVDATFPEDYGIEELNGKTAQFEMKLNKIQEASYPELSDAFIAENTDYQTVTEYYTSISEKLVAQSESSSVVTQKNEAFSKVYPNVEILKVPEKEYTKYYQEFVAQYYSLAEQYGQDFETFITETAGSTVEEFKQYAEEYANSTVEMELVFFAIANREGIIDGLTKAHYDDYLENIAAEYMSTPTEFVEMYGEESVWRSLVWDSVMDFVLAKGVAVEPESTEEPEVEVELENVEVVEPTEGEATATDADLEAAE